MMDNDAGEWFRKYDSGIRTGVFSFSNHGKTIKLYHRSFFGTRLEYCLTNRYTASVFMDDKTGIIVKEGKPEEIDELKRIAKSALSSPGLGDKERERLSRLLSMIESC